MDVILAAHQSQQKFSAFTDLPPGLLLYSNWRADRKGNDQVPSNLHSESEPSSPSSLKSSSWSSLHSLEAEDCCQLVGRHFHYKFSDEEFYESCRESITDDALEQVHQRVGQKQSPVVRVTSEHPLTRQSTFRRRYHAVILRGAPVGEEQGQEEEPQPVSVQRSSAMSPSVQCPPEHVMTRCLPVPLYERLRSQVGGSDAVSPSPALSAEPSAAAIVPVAAAVKHAEEDFDSADDIEEVPPAAAVQPLTYGESFASMDPLEDEMDEASEEAVEEPLAASRHVQFISPECNDEIMMPAHREVVHSPILVACQPFRAAKHNSEFYELESVEDRGQQQYAPLLVKDPFTVPVLHAEESFTSCDDVVVCTAAHPDGVPAVTEEAFDSCDDDDEVPVVPADVEEDDVTPLAPVPVAVPAKVATPSPPRVVAEEAFDSCDDINEEEDPTPLVAAVDAPLHMDDVEAFDSYDVSEVMPMATAAPAAATLNRYEAEEGFDSCQDSVFIAATSAGNPSITSSSMSTGHVVAADAVVHASPQSFAGLRPPQNHFRANAVQSAASTPEQGAVAMCYPFCAWRANLSSPSQLYEYYCQQYRTKPVQAVSSQLASQSSQGRRRSLAEVGDAARDPCGLHQVVELTAANLDLTDRDMLPILETLRWCPSLRHVNVSNNHLTNECLEWVSYSVMDETNASLNRGAMRVLVPSSRHQPISSNSSASTAQPSPHSPPGGDEVSQEVLHQFFMRFFSGEEPADAEESASVISCEAGNATAAYDLLETFIISGNQISNGGLLLCNRIVESRPQLHFYVEGAVRRRVRGKLLRLHQNVHVAASKRKNNDL